MHWFEKKQNNAMKEAQEFFQQFKAISHEKVIKVDEEITVNLNEFKNNAKNNNNYTTNVYERNKLSTQSKSLLDEYEHSKSNEVLFDLESTLAKINILDSVIEYQFSSEKLKERRKQLQFLEPFNQNQNKEVRKVYEREIEQYDAHKENVSKLDTVIDKITEYYQKDSSLNKKAVQFDINKLNHGILSNLNKIEDNAKRSYLDASRGDSFSHVLRIVSNSEMGYEVEKSFIKVAGMNEKHNEFVNTMRRYAHFKNEVDYKVNKIKNKEKNSNLDDLSKLFK